MRKLKRLAAVLVCMAMILAFIPAMTVGAADDGPPSFGTCGDNLTWKITDDWTLLTISGTGKMEDYDYGTHFLVIPWESLKSLIEAVVIEDGVTSIGDYAFFNCGGLASITIPDSVTSIGDDAFEGCDSLTSISIPDGVTSIGHGTFYGCTSLTSVSLPDSVTSIDYYAFYGCTSLESVSMGSGVTSIGTKVFYKCTSLESVTIPASLTSIGDYAFYWCTSLTDVYYGGSEEDWANISIGSSNECLTEAQIYYNSTGIPEIPAQITYSSAGRFEDEESGEEIVYVYVEVEELPAVSNVVVVGYDSDGVVSGLTEADGYGEAYLPAETQRVKIFVWESLETLRPLCEAAEEEVYEWTWDEEYEEEY